MPKISKRARKYRKKSNSGEKSNTGIAGTRGAKEKNVVKASAKEVGDAAKAVREGYCEDDFE